MTRIRRSGSGSLYERTSFGRRGLLYTRWVFAARVDGDKRRTKSFPTEKAARAYIKANYPELIENETWKHGASTQGYQNYGCRCQLCRDAFNAVASKRRERKQREDQIKHGTATAYVNDGCRCDACLVAVRVRRASLAKKAVQEGRISHGTPSAYTNKGCRCDLCGAARHRESTRNKQHLLKKIADGNRAINHGRYSGYWAGCRCLACYAVMNNKRQTEITSNDVSREIATNHGKEFTGAELQRIAETMNRPVRDVATEMSRTLKSISSVRSKINRRDPKTLRALGEM